MITESTICRDLFIAAAGDFIRCEEDLIRLQQRIQKVIAASCQIGGPSVRDLVIIKQAITRNFEKRYTSMMNSSQERPA